MGSIGMEHHAGARLVIIRLVLTVLVVSMGLTLMGQVVPVTMYRYAQTLISFGMEQGVFVCLGTSHMEILVFDVLLEPIGMEFAVSILQVLLPLYKLQMAIDSTSLTFMFQISGLFYTIYYFIPSHIIYYKILLLLLYFSPSP
jgi:hypothetical protein